MASRVAIASANCARSVPISSRNLSLVWDGVAMSICMLRASAFFQIQSEQYFFAVGQIADDTAQWKRQFLDQCRRGDDLFVVCQLRMLIDVRHFQSVAAIEMLLANLFEILD